MVVPYNQSEVLAAALKKAGVETVFVAVEGAGHGNFPGREAEDRARAFFARHLRGQEVEVSPSPIRADRP